MDANFAQAAISRQESEESIVVVMGVIGAGKSYFIKQVTGSTTIRVGLGLQSGEFITLSPRPKVS